jgi:hypothetical protein
MSCKPVFIAFLSAAFLFNFARSAPAQNLIANSGFESTPGWQVQMQNGASGNFSFDAAKARSGKQSLKLVKTNGLGYVELRSEKPIRIEPGVLYTFRGWFHAEDAPISSLLLFRISRDGKTLSYNSIDRTPGFKSQSLLINAPAGKWQKRAITYRSDEPQEIYLHVALWGNPATVWLDDLELSPGVVKGQSVPATFESPFSREQVLQTLETRANASAQVVEKNGAMQLQINAAPQPFVFYKGMQPGEKSGDQEAFGKAGVNLVSVAIQLGQSRYAYVPHDEKTIWAGNGKINFDVIDEILATTLRRNPNANLILEMWVYPYREWGEENPDDIVRNDKGERGYGIWGNLTGYTDDLEKVGTTQNKAWWYPSYQSEKWRRDSSAALAAIAQHLKTSPYGKSVVGFFISGGQDLRFDSFFYDYSKPSQDSFRAWALKKYGTVEKVAAAWKQPITTPEQIVVPPFNTQKMEDGAPYQNPGALLDYREFKEEGSWELRDGYAGVLKAAIGKPVVTLSYNAPVSENFLKTRYLDASGDMSYYPYRNPGYALGWIKGDDFKLHRKMFLQEVDLRSYVGSRYDEIYQMHIGAGDSPVEWDAVHRKLVGVSLAHGYGWWYYDMGRYFADPAIHQKIGETMRVAQKVEAMPADNFRADVCVIERDTPSPYLSGRFTATDFGGDYQDMMLESSGVPFETHYLNDVLNHPGLQNFKVYVFRQNAFITQEQRRKIKDKLLNKNRTIVWMNDAGYISENGKSAAAMSELIGMTIETEEKHARRNAIISDAANPLTRNVLPLQGAGEMLLAIFNTNGNATSFAARSQPFWISDASATALAKYQETGQSAMAVRKMGDWTSIYLAAPQALGPQLLNNIARQAGAFVAGEVGQMLHMNGNFASLHGLKNGRYTLQLPFGKTRVLDAVSGRVLASGREYSWPVQAQNTYWFLFE